MQMVLVRSTDREKVTVPSPTVPGSVILIRSLNNTQIDKWHVRRVVIGSIGGIKDVPSA